MEGAHRLDSAWRRALQLKKLLCSSLLLVAGGSCYAATITWANNMFPPSPGIVNLGVTSKNILDDTNTFNLPVNSLTVTNMPDIAAIGLMLSPSYTAPNTLGYQNDPEGTEPGVGVYNGSDPELRLGYTLQIDLSGFLFNTVSFTIDSIDGPDQGYRIWGSTTAGGTMTLLAQSNFTTGGFVQTQTLDNTYKFFEVTSHMPHNDIDSVVLKSVMISSVPEPATVGIVGIGLLAAGLLGRRRRT
jgi:hypothetical protein